LTNSIERLIERINSMQDEIQRLIEGLVKRGMRERADAVSTAVDDVIERCRHAVREMYSSNMTVPCTESNDGPTDADMTRPTGGDATLWDSLQEVGRKREPPVVKAFTRLSLLG
jgi:elongator complex protein 1